VADYDRLKRCSGYREQILGVPSIATVNSAAAAAGHVPGATGGEHEKFVQSKRQVNHLTPKAAGGCPIGDNNLSANASLCDVCAKIEVQFTLWQTMRPLNP
jgi:hypothetical protein